MNKDKMRLWVDALRSGDYAQGQGYLAVRDGGNDSVAYCCLGVACEVAIKDGLKLVVNEDETAISFDGEDLHLPNSVRLWLGADNTPEIPFDGRDRTVIEINDDLYWNFNRIADSLEDTYLKEDK